MVKFENAIERVLEMAKAKHKSNTLWSRVDEKIEAENAYQQECLAVVEDFIVNQLGED
jgi:acyl-CoA thioesterase